MIKDILGGRLSTDGLDKTVEVSLVLKMNVFGN